MFSDEAIGSVQAMLLTFTNVKGSVMTDATKTVLDMSQALGQDTKSSAIQLGKALNDPIVGITALQRVGVTFNASQKDTIAGLVNTGKTAEAQRVILAELQKEFGGSAEAAGTTFAGQLEILKNQLDNVKETIGGVIMQALQPLIASSLKFVEAVDWTAVIAKVTDSLSRAKDMIILFTKPIVDFLVKHKDPILKFLKDFGVALLIVVPTLAIGAAAVALFTNPLFLITLAVTAVIFAFNALKPQITAVGNAMANVGRTIMNVFNAVVSGVMWLKDNWIQAIGYMIGFFATLPIRLPILMVEAVIGIARAIGSINWGAVWNVITGAFIGAMNGIKNAFMDAYNFLKNLNWGSVLAGIGRGVGNAIIDLIQGAINGALSAIPGHPTVHLPHFAGGVQNFKGGMAVVGEQGPEAVFLPKGSSVATATQTAAMGNRTSVNIGTIVLGTPAAARTFFDQLDQDTMNIGKGLTPSRGLA